MNQLHWTINEINNHFIGLCFSNKGLYACTIPHTSHEGLKNSIVNYGLNAEVVENSSGVSNTKLQTKLSQIIWKRWMGTDNYLDNDLPLDFTSYSPKQISVFRASSKIPYGEVLSYGKLAEKAGFPRAARFVGTCMSKNRFPLIFPCHRVVRSNSLGRYGNSPESSEIKRLLLEREG
ncbi:MAG: methylated-DNA--[protein]-cysteine S-methyltransferase, partial [Candidatus Hodarchaeales archaeon]